MKCVQQIFTANPLTNVHGHKEHGRGVDGLNVDELDRVDGGDREGRRLLVRVVQLVEVPSIMDRVECAHSNAFAGVQLGEIQSFQLKVSFTQFALSFECSWCPSL